ncbi:MAG: hypothetical protein ACE5HN_03100 [Nitrospiria bacterium]
MNRLVLILLSLLFWPEPALAHGITSPQGLLAEMIIIPIALLLYVLTGAAAHYEQGIPRKLIGPRMVALLWTFFGLILSAIGMEFAALISLGMGIYAVKLGIKMLRVKRGPSLRLGVWVPRITGGILIPLAVFLSLLTSALNGSFQRDLYVRHSLPKTMQEFADYQNGYAATHDGRYQEVAPKRWDEIETIKDPDEQEAYRQSGIWNLSKLMIYKDRRHMEYTITYSQDPRTYALRVTPTKFLRWPYNYFAPRRAYYMDQTGVIRYEKMTGPGKEASADSLPME